MFYIDRDAGEGQVVIITISLSKIFNNATLETRDLRLSRISLPLVNFEVFDSHIHLEFFLAIAVLLT